jgi:hypothetical protein
MVWFSFQWYKTNGRLKKTILIFCYYKYKFVVKKSLLPKAYLLGLNKAEVLYSFLFFDPPPPRPPRPSLFSVYFCNNPGVHRSSSMTALKKAFACSRAITCMLFYTYQWYFPIMKQATWTKFWVPRPRLKAYAGHIWPFLIPRVRLYTVLFCILQSPTPFFYWRKCLLLQ